jgi:hypothetical protein
MSDMCSEDTELKALTLLGQSLPDTDAQMLRTLCSAAEIRLKSMLRKGVTAEDTGEAFSTAAAMLASAMYLDMLTAQAGGVSAFTSGRLSVQTDPSCAAALRKAAEDILDAYIDKGGFEFKGVRS